VGLENQSSSSLSLLSKTWFYHQH